MKIFKSQYRFSFFVFLSFLLIDFLIVILHLLFHPLRVLGMNTSIFYMDEKYTLAAFWTTTSAFLVGFLNLKQIYFLKTTKEKVVDLGYSIFFLLLSLDEYFEIHEYLNDVLKNHLQKNSLLGLLANFSWIFPLSIIIFLILLLLFWKIKTSQKKFKIPLFLGCLSFLLVLFFEFLGSATYGQNIYLYFVALEEGLEMIGLSFFLLETLMKEYNLKI